ncbi:MAG TPA: thermonuclease family protein [Syntrophorhabdaceae bacterium]|jgi:micrococcal nuclease
MKRLIALFVFIGIIGMAAASFGKDFVVRKVLSGDTVQLESGEIVRYLGIDAPELFLKEGGSEFFAKEAARHNKKLVLLKKVRLEFDSEKKDHYGRLLAYVFVKNVFINGELVKGGYARATVKPPNVKYKDMLLDYQKKAMEEERGLWQEKKKDTEKYYIGNKRSYVLHRPSCKNALKIPDKNKIVFHNRMDAIKIGYVPDKYCKP